MLAILHLACATWLQPWDTGFGKSKRSNTRNARVDVLIHAVLCCVQFQSTSHSMYHRVKQLDQRLEKFISGQKYHGCQTATQYTRSEKGGLQRREVC